MSEIMRDSVEECFQKTLAIIQTENSVDILKELKKTEEIVNILLKNPEHEFFKENLQIKLQYVFSIGHFLQSKGLFAQAQNFYKLSILISQNLLLTYPENALYKSYIGTILNNLGALLWTMGRHEEAKQKYEKSLKIYETYSRPI